MSSTEPLGQTDSADSDSEVWQFFTKDDDDDDDQPVAVCNQNGCNFNADISDYDNMWSHLSVSHAEIYKGTARYKTTIKQRPKRRVKGVARAAPSPATRRVERQHKPDRHHEAPDCRTKCSGDPVTAQPAKAEHVSVATSCQLSTRL